MQFEIYLGMCLSYLTYWMYIFKRLMGAKKKNNRRQISVYNNARGWLVVCFDRVHFSVHKVLSEKKKLMYIHFVFDNISKSRVFIGK